MTNPTTPVDSQYDLDECCRKSRQGARVQQVTERRQYELCLLVLGQLTGTLSGQISPVTSFGPDRLNTATFSNRQGTYTLYFEETGVTLRVAPVNPDYMVATIQIDRKDGLSPQDIAMILKCLDNNLPIRPGEEEGDPSICTSPRCPTHNRQLVAH